MSVDLEPLPRIKASQGDPDFERIIDLVEAMMRGAAADQLRDYVDPAHHSAMTMAAAGVLAGYLAGASIIAGIASDRDKRRMGEMLLTNFRQGIGIGKSNALRTATEQFGGNA